MEKLTTEDLIQELEDITGAEIPEDIMQEIEFNEEYNATYRKSNKEYRDYYVFIPEFKNNPIIGYPYVILAKENNIRISNNEESIDLLNY